ncbi:MAG: metallophosphoesterase [Sphingomonas sp.]|uniref:metallophosphoesterase family protein n=1 Tax=Sphingomonas sp. TaxID=28214 RepID=UPI0035612B78
MTSRSTFRWLHFSDIHVGMSALPRLWPRSATLLLDDLETAHRKAGGFDCLIFSGDLVQRGEAAEFDAFDEIIDRILARLGDLGPKPSLMTIPGNHDLVRPDPLNPAALALAQYWSQSSLRERMWDADQPYLAFLKSVFEAYSGWRARAISRGVHLAPAVEGLLPGDASYVIQTPTGEIGLVGLNSTWLQLGGGDYKGGLHVDARQLLAVTEGRPDDWLRDNEINLLVTHQPATWLHADSPASWDNDINPSGRFDAHLFGHMHEPDILTTAHGGGPTRRHVQAASLFGLETYGDGSTRIQGYSADTIIVEDAERTLTTWPRRLIQVSDGRMKLVPDTTQDIDEETGSLTISYRVDRRPTAQAIVAPPPTPSGPAPQTSTVIAGSDFDLAAIQLPIAEARAHLKVRRVEQNAMVASLNADRAAWLVSDWGIGKDGFISAICSQVGIARDKVYSLDFGSYTNSSAFFDALRTLLGASFQDICDAIAEAGPCLLILDDLDVSASVAGTEEAVEALIGPVRDFAPDAQIMIRSRRRPRKASLSVVELKPLDEADVAIYARESELGGERYAKPDAVSMLYRHTDGVPTRIDDALRDLEIVSLGDLMAANPDYGDAAVAISKAPTALVATVSELASSDDRAEERAYNLLLALAALPQGERLARITRFLGPHPFFASHARALLERSLIDTVAITALDGMPGDDTQKALIVPRPVREYVRSIMDEQTARTIDRKALELYFGEDWASAGIRQSPTGKRVRNALCDGYEIQNASALILRSARRSLGEDNKVEAEGLIRLGTGFIEALMSGDHFRSAVALCEDMIRLLEDFGGHTREINVLRYELARGLRMIDRRLEAQIAFEELDHVLLSKEQRQSAELGLALLLSQLGDQAGATEAARRAIALDRKSVAAIHAKTILAESLDDPAERTAELRRLLAAARKVDATTLASTILLDLAQEEADEHAAATMLKEVIQTRGSKQDFYNNVRAIVNLAQRHKGPHPLSSADRTRLMDAYHFLYDERLGLLFNRCHEALWADFERTGEILNLLNLFRHSSFIWRLAGRDDMEATYLAKLVKRFKEVLAIDTINSSRDGAYFIVRVSVVMNELDFKPGSSVA